MNVAQVLRAALYDADAVRLDGTTHRFVTQQELLTWAQEGHALLYGKLRQANQDYGLITRQSTDADLRWNGITYDCSTFGLTTTAKTYTLPPDLIELRQIRALTSGEEGRVFCFRDLSDPWSVEQARVESTTTNSGVIYYDLVGERTLRLSQPPDAALDIELSYIARPQALTLYGAASVSLTQDSASVTGASGANWVIQELAPPLDLIVGTDAIQPWVVSDTVGGLMVNPSAVYAPVSSIDTNTTLTLLGAWRPASVSARGYLLASVPSVPADWHWVLIRWVTAMIRWKATGAPTAERPDFEAIMAKDMLPSVSQRQTADFQYVEDFDPE